MLNQRHQDLLEARGLDPELLVRLGVVSSDRGSDWIEIPFMAGGECVNRKFRTISGEKRFGQDAGARKCFWNLDALADPTLKRMPLIVTEGEFDAMAAIQAGFPKSLSVPDGAPPRAIGDGETAKYGYLDDAEKLLRDEREIILATDGDGPGIALMNDLALRLGRHRCKWVRYPVGCKDLCDALARYGARGVVETLARAQWIKVAGVYRMSELPPLPETATFSTGIAALDPHWKLRAGDFAVVTGIPSHGKTTLVNEIAARKATAGWVVVVASFEQRPQSDHRRSLRTFFHAKPEAEQTAEEIGRADKWIEAQFLFVVPDEDEDADLPWVLDRLAAAVVQQGARLAILDPWNEMDHVRPADMSLTEYTGFAIKQFRRFAWKYRVPVIVVAHPVKLGRGTDGKLACPTLYDISDSAHWANKSDVGVVVYREKGTTTIAVRKTRYAAIGELGEVQAMYLPSQARFEIIVAEAL